MNAQNVSRRSLAVHLMSVVLLAVVAALTCSGCSKSSSLYSVTGTVLVKGEPAEGAVVLFHPEGNPRGLTASGIVGEDGMFVLSSGFEQGIAVGNYRVTVVWPDPSKKPKESAIMMGGPPNIPDLFKGRYARRDGSKLTAEIDASTTEIPAFELQLP